MDLLKLIRPHLLHVQPYSSARDEYEGNKGILLDANENSLGSVCSGEFHRYPDPHHLELRQHLSKSKNISIDKIFVGNGSDEPIDLLIRLFCRPGIDNIIICPPTYGMYAVAAALNDVEVREAQLTEAFQPNIELIMSLANSYTKLLFLCSPNNPTGNLIDPQIIKNILDHFNALVVIDEAYIDFAHASSWLTRLHEYTHLIILQTFSKAWGMANLRVGVCYASALITYYLDRLKPPYNLNGFSQKAAIEALRNEAIKEKYVHILISERERLKNELSQFPFVRKIFPSDANFLLVRVDNAKKLYEYLLQHGIIVRNRSALPLCENTLRITVGTIEENSRLLHVLKTFSD